jgi:YD repeat-containing protein
VKGFASRQATKATTYDTARWVDTVTDPRGIQGKTFYDNLGRTTKSVSAYDGGAITNNTNKTTEFTYDGSNHMLTYQADLVGGAYEQTKYLYNATTASGSGINSFDVLSSMQYPDKTSGNPSGTEQETYTVNGLGQSLTTKDRNGNVHTYAYDVLGRLTSDQVTTFGMGVDNAVQRIDTAYDTQGNAYLVSS